MGGVATDLVSQRKMEEAAAAEAAAAAAPLPEDTPMQPTEEEALDDAKPSQPLQDGPQPLAVAPVAAEKTPIGVVLNPSLAPLVVSGVFPHGKCVAETPLSTHLHFASAYLPVHTPHSIFDLFSHVHEFREGPSTDNPTQSIQSRAAQMHCGVSCACQK